MITRFVNHRPALETVNLLRGLKISTMASTTKMAKKMPKRTIFSVSSKTIGKRPPLLACLNSFGFFGHP
ncbi:MAG: hypothetical protein ACD_75C00419G0002 [uncultured bacterium]|nr:MAG: hypothetical protein ACD_75C00419G0002 [uncultured bacterium]